MRIKRFIAADMRSALQMVRAEQGAEAVILSSHPTANGIEVVAATDYDEALVHQALRAAAPGMQRAADRSAAASNAATSTGTHTASSATASAQTETTADATVAPTRESFASRARAVFRLGDSPAAEKSAKPSTEQTLEELIGRSHAAPLAVDPVAALAAPRVSATAHAPSEAPVRFPTGSAASSQFHAMMAAMVEPETVNTAPVAMPAAVAAVAAAPVAAPATPAVAPVAVAVAAPPPAPAPTAAPATLVEPANPAQFPNNAPTAPEIAQRSALDTTAQQPDTSVAIATDVAAEVAPTPGPVAAVLHAVADPDPGIIAMREELSSMRHMIEREMGQFTVERLRGSPARAAAYDMLLGYGCDESLAQTIVAKLNPALAPDQVRAPILAELARSLTITRSEPIDEGGVIALIGPTGAGKTTTVAKLAARFAARHRARDVAMVTTDSERPGAIEQLYAHGRRLGITVCEARGTQGLAETLEQLQDYPLVLVDTAGYGARDRALLGQITWLRATGKLRSLLVMPANAHPHDLNELVRRYRMACVEGVILSKTDETGRLGAVLSVAVHNGLSLAYTTNGQQVPGDLEAADASNLVLQLEKLRRAADNPFVTEDHHAIA